MYFLFCFDAYNPGGGINDSKGIFDSLDLAKASYVGDEQFAEIAIVEYGKFKLILEGFRAYKPSLNQDKIFWRESL